MACEEMARKNEQKLARDNAIKDLMARLKTREAQIKNDGSRVTIAGWDNRGGWCDECAIRTLRQSEDFQIRQIVAAAVPTASGITFGHGH